jgi:biopolymer transport protein ExbB
MVLALFAASYTSPTARADESSAGDNVVDTSETDEEADAEESEDEGKGGISLLPEEGKLSLIELVWAGKWLMVPIIIMAFLVVMFGIERGLALRRSRVMPEELVESLGRLANAPGGFDPRKAYRECQKYPSASAAVIKAMLLKVGRPHAEVERTVKEASNREASRLYGNVRWLNLGSGVTPLMGLFGTVWGMILAFLPNSPFARGCQQGGRLGRGYLPCVGHHARWTVGGDSSRDSGSLLRVSD